MNYLVHYLLWNDFRLALLPVNRFEEKNGTQKIRTSDLLIGFRDISLVHLFTLVTQILQKDNFRD